MSSGSLLKREREMQGLLKHLKKITMEKGRCPSFFNLRCIEGLQIWLSYIRVEGGGHRATLFKKLCLYIAHMEPLFLTQVYLSKSGTARTLHRNMNYHHLAR